VSSYNQSLPPLLAKGLRVVFVGAEPGPESLMFGHYYAARSNSFYSDLKESGFITSILKPEQGMSLLGYGIKGFFGI
jgi:G:T/U-mismatch repair DNA glycosylase